MKPLASIIIPTFMREELLVMGLTSLSKQDCAKQIEVIVINDGIPDKTEEICKKFGAHYIFSGQRNEDGIKPRIPGFAINIGVKQASSPVVLLTCPEVYQLRSYGVSSLIYAPAHDKKVMSTPYKVFDDQSGEVLQSIRNGNAEIRLCKTLYPDFVANPYMPYSMAIRKRDFITIGGYDEDFIGKCADDNDFVERMQLFGCKYNPVKVEIIHLYHGFKNNNGPMYDYNVKLWKERKGTIYRNKKKDWGKI